MFLMSAILTLTIRPYQFVDPGENTVFGSLFQSCPPLALLNSLRFNITWMVRRRKWRYTDCNSVVCVARCQVVNWPHYFFDCYAYASLKPGYNTIVGAFHHKIEDSIHGCLNVIWSVLQQRSWRQYCTVGGTLLAISFCPSINRIDCVVYRHT